MDKLLKHAEAIERSLTDSPKSSVVFFFHLRMLARGLHEELESLRTDARRARRERSRLEANPFNAHRIGLWDQYISRTDAFVKNSREALRLTGRDLIDLAPQVDAMTTMTDRLDLLNCNSADRADLPEPDIGLVQLIGVYCVEDSAEHRNDEWNDRPLHAAVNAEVQHVMFDTPEGRAASDKLFAGLFAPGGMFESVPKYYLQPDGTMLRQAPPLTLHDASGSRVIERTPS